eukprot:747426-Rhodomonas_salina.1
MAGRSCARAQAERDGWAMVMLTTGLRDDGDDGEDCANDDDHVSVMTERLATMAGTGVEQPARAQAQRDRYPPHPRYPPTRALRESGTGIA